MYILVHVMCVYIYNVHVCGYTCVSICAYCMCSFLACSLSRPYCTASQSFHFSPRHFCSVVSLCKSGGCCCSAVSFCLLECSLMQIWRLLLLSSLLLPLGMLTHANLEVVAAQQSLSASWNAHSCKSGGCCCSAVSFCLLECSLMQIWRLLLLSSLLLPYGMLTHANLEVVAAQQSPSASWNAHSCKSGGCSCSAVSFCLLECSHMQIWRL